ncbi:MAG: serine/threonine protein kinase [Pseudomonadales bacterium]|nr:serine/threonine protein kinase [Pseudomonadales bacterium]
MNSYPDIPDYQIETRIGHGGMANVYRAKHLRLDRLVALKIMHADLLSRDSHFSERFLREARIAADLSHPHLVQVYDVNKHQQYHYIAMEYVSGGDLEQRLSDYIDNKTLLTIMEDILNGLDYAHQKGYIHRDIKPANVLFRKTGEALLSDFGIARALHSNTQMTEFGSVLGTPAYMSPEQASGKPLAGRSDLYSVAVMIYRILTGEAPYQGDTSLTIAIKHVNEPIPRLPPSIAAMQAFIDKGMAKNPGQRFVNGQQMIDALRDALNTLKSDDVNATKTLVLANIAESESHKPKQHSAELELSMQASQPTQSSAENSNNSTSITLQIPAQLTAKNVLLVLLVGLVFTGIGLWINATPGMNENNRHQAAENLASSNGLNNERRARIEMLLAAAQGDILAGRLYKPTGANAVEKYQQARDIAPNYQPIQDAREYLGGLLLQHSASAQQQEHWLEASEYAIQAMALLPNSNSAALQLDEIRAQQAAIAMVYQQQLLSAQAAANAGQWHAAVLSFQDLQSQTPLPASVKQEIAHHSEQLLDQANKLIQKKRYADADIKLDQALKMAELLDQDSLQQDILDARKLSRRQQSHIQQQQRAGALLKKAASTTDSEKALKLYMQILDQSPANTAAKKGVKKKTSLVINRVNKAILIGSVPQAKRLIALLEAVDKKQLMSLEQQQQLNILHGDLSIAEEKRVSINKLINRFDRYMQKPKVTSAHKIYKKIIKISHTDQRLTGLRRQLCEGYLAVANKEAASGDWRGALKWAQRGLEVDPHYVRLKILAEKAKAKS